jgi:hypothetical protein
VPAPLRLINNDERSERKEIEIALVIDTSNSIDEGSLDKITKACELFIFRSPDDSVFPIRYSIISFNDKVTLHHRFSTDKQSLIRSVIGVYPVPMLLSFLFVLLCCFVVAIFSLVLLCCLLLFNSLLPFVMSILYCQPLCRWHNKYSNSVCLLCICLCNINSLTLSHLLVYDINSFAFVRSFVNSF